MSQFAPAFRDMPIEPSQVVKLFQRHLGTETVLSELTVYDQRNWDIAIWGELENPDGYILRYRQHGGDQIEQGEFKVDKSGELSHGWIIVGLSGKKNPGRKATEQDLHAALTMLQADELFLGVKLPKRPEGGTA